MTQKIPWVIVSYTETDPNTHYTTITYLNWQPGVSIPGSGKAGADRVDISLQRTVRVLPRQCLRVDVALQSGVGRFEIIYIRLHVAVVARDVIRRKSHRSGLSVYARHRGSGKLRGVEAYLDLMLQLIVRDDDGGISEVTRTPPIRNNRVTRRSSTIDDRRTIRWVGHIT